MDVDKPKNKKQKLIKAVIDAIKKKKRRRRKPKTLTEKKLAGKLILPSVESAIAGARQGLGYNRGMAYGQQLVNPTAGVYGVAQNAVRDALQPILQYGSGSYVQPARPVARPEPPVAIPERPLAIMGLGRNLVSNVNYYLRLGYNADDALRLARQTQADIERGMSPDEARRINTLQQPRSALNRALFGTAEDPRMIGPAIEEDIIVPDRPSPRRSTRVLPVVPPLNFSSILAQQGGGYIPSEGQAGGDESSTESSSSGRDSGSELISLRRPANLTTGFNMQAAVGNMVRQNYGQNPVSIRPPGVISRPPNTDQGEEHDGLLSNSPTSFFPFPPRSGPNPVDTINMYGLDELERQALRQGQRLREIRMDMEQIMRRRPMRMQSPSSSTVSSLSTPDLQQVPQNMQEIGEYLNRAEMMTNDPMFLPSEPSTTSSYDTSQSGGMIYYEAPRFV
jgi:hypothetical protein